MAESVEKEIIIKKLKGEKIEDKYALPVYENPASGYMSDAKTYYSAYSENIASFLWTLDQELYHRTDELRKQTEFGRKCLTLFKLMNRWMAINQRGKCILEYFEKKGYKKIAVYGLHYVGERLCDELRDTDIQIAYTMDKNKDRGYYGIKNYAKFNKLPSVDAVIVTPVTFYAEIKDELQDKVKCPIISFDAVISEIEKEL